jgi:hypothetical protein
VKKSARLGRRHFLGGLGVAGASSLFVPLLDVHAEAEPEPKRLVFFFTTNGTIRESWLPSMKGRELQLSPILAPLERHKPELLVVDGLAHRVILEKGARNGHSAGINTALTGMRAKSIDPQFPLRSMATGISVDQYLAKTLSAGKKFKSIECGIQVINFSTDDSCLSYHGPLHPISADNSPYSVFDRVFRGLSVKKDVGPDPAETQRLTDREVVLGAVAKDLERVKRELPASDRVKMDAHLSAVEALSNSLTTGVGDGAALACGLPSLGKRIDPHVNDHVPAIGRLQMDLLVMALACDLTRVGTIQYGRAGAAHRFNWLGPEFASDPTLAVTDQAKGFHALAHKESDPEVRKKLVKIHTWYAGELAYLLDKLRAIPERGKTMLDHTLVVWVNELGSGGGHTHEEVPWLMAGSAALAQRPASLGRLVSFPGEPHNRLLLTICHAMGAFDRTFGDPDFCGAGPLTGLSV